ncbi:hypothetical protein NFJ02_42g108800 [Pycnococcus provasolii]
MSSPISSTQQQMVVASSSSLSSDSDSSAPSWVVVELDLHVNVNDSLPLGSRNYSEQHHQHKLEHAGSGGELTELYEHASRSKKRLFPCGEEEKFSRVKGNECEACGGNIVSMGCDGDDTDDIVQHFRYSTSSSHHEARFLALLQNYTWEYNEVRKVRMKPTVVKNGVAAAA